MWQGGAGALSRLPPLTEEPSNGGGVTKRWVLYMYVSTQHTVYCCHGHMSDTHWEHLDAPPLHNMYVDL